MWQQPKVYEFHYRGNVTIVGGHPYLLPLTALGAGAVLFANGFWIFRRMRLVEDTPPIAIRSAPMGLVHVRGKPTGKFLVTSPVSHTPCFCYRLVTEKRDPQKNQWVRQWPDQRDQRVFYLDDGTGKVLVNPLGAEQDLPATFQGTVGEKRYTEYCVLPENEYNVTGTCVENPNPSDEGDRNMIQKGENERTFLISGLSERRLDRRLLRRARVRIAIGALVMLASLLILIHNVLAP